MNELFSEVLRKRAYLAKATAAALVFWLAQLAFQLYVAGAPFNAAVARSLAFSAATLVGLAFLAGPLAITAPRFAWLVRHRRALGVAGFIFGVAHWQFVTAKYFSYNAAVLAELNPLRNPLVFGLLALLFLLPAFLTSVDWAMRKLGGKWKLAQRTAYAGFIVLVLHFSFQNPAQLATLPGVLLLAVTMAAMVLMLLVFARRVAAGRSGKGVFVGIALALAGILLLAAMLAR